MLGLTLGVPLCSAAGLPAQRRESSTNMPAPDFVRPIWSAQGSIAGSLVVGSAA